MRAPRARACSRSSMTNMAHPSPRTKPLRVRSNGRDAVAGVSLRGEVALIASKQAEVMGVRGASVLPTTKIGRHTSELQSRENLVCRLLLEKKDEEQENTERGDHTVAGSG